MSPRTDQRSEDYIPDVALSVHAQEPSNVLLKPLRHRTLAVFLNAFDRGLLAMQGSSLKANIPELDRYFRLERIDGLAITSFARPSSMSDCSIAWTFGRPMNTT